MKFVNAFFASLLLVSLEFSYSFLIQPSSIFRKSRKTSSQIIYGTKISNIEVNDISELAEPKNITDISLGLYQLKPFLEIAVPFFKEDVTARNNLLSVVALTLLNSGVSVAFSYISRDFYNALNIRDEAVFYQKIGFFFAALVVAVPVSVFYRFLREKLSLYWREALTAKVLDKYYANRTFYVLETMKNVDNPDQRISDDIRAFTRTSLDFFITLLTSIIDLFSFSAILFQIYPGLFVGILLYAGFGSIITTNLGRSLVGLNYDQLIKEANFRFALIRTRENAEAIAFYDSNAKLEQSGLWELFQEILRNQLGIVTTQRNLEFFTTSYRYLVQILPSLIVAPLYFAGKVELGAISQSYGAFNHILGDFSLIVNSFESLSAFSAGLTRLSVFLEKIQQGGWNMTIDTLPNPSSINDDNLEQVLSVTLSSTGIRNDNRGVLSQFGDKPRIQLIKSTNTIINLITAPPLLLQCRNVTVLTPDSSRILVGGIPKGDHTLSGIDFEMRCGDRVLIVGPSGAGKSSFVRSIAGLWQVGSGSIEWYSSPTSSSSSSGSSSSSSDPEAAPPGVFFLPQKPYNFLGTLREQIQYPSIKSQEKKGVVVAASSNTSTTTIRDNISLKVGDEDDDDDDERYLQILNQVMLGGLAERVGKGNAYQGLDARSDWSNMLSLGEQQRLSFARVLYNHPATVVLDEATSALDLTTEEVMYKLLKDLEVSFISVGHRPSLLKYHSSKLILNGPSMDKTYVSIDQSKVNDFVDLTDVNS